MDVEFTDLRGGGARWLRHTDVMPVIQAETELQSQPFKGDSRWTKYGLIDNSPEVVNHVKYDITLEDADGNDGKEEKNIESKWINGIFDAKFAAQAAAGAPSGHGSSSRQKYNHTRVVGTPQWRRSFDIEIAGTAKPSTGVAADLVHPPETDASSDDLFFDVLTKDFTPGAGGKMAQSGDDLDGEAIWDADIERAKVARCHSDGGYTIEYVNSKRGQERCPPSSYRCFPALPAGQMVSVYISDEEVDEDAAPATPAKKKGPPPPPKLGWLPAVIDEDYGNGYYDVALVTDPKDEDSDDGNVLAVLNGEEVDDTPKEPEKKLLLKIPRQRLALAENGIVAYRKVGDQRRLKGRVKEPAYHWVFTLDYEEAEKEFNKNVEEIALPSGIPVMVEPVIGAKQGATHGRSPGKDADSMKGWRCGKVSAHDEATNSYTIAFDEEPEVEDAKNDDIDEDSDGQDGWMDDEDAPREAQPLVRTESGVVLKRLCPYGPGKNAQVYARCHDGVFVQGNVSNLTKGGDLVDVKYEELNVKISMLRPGVSRGCPVVARYMTRERFTGVVKEIHNPSLQKWKQGLGDIVDLVPCRSMYDIRFDGTGAMCKGIRRTALWSTDWASFEIQIGMVLEIKKDNGRAWYLGKVMEVSAGSPDPRRRKIGGAAGGEKVAMDDEEAEITYTIDYPDGTVEVMVPKKRMREIFKVGSKLKAMKSGNQKWKLGRVLSHDPPNSHRAVYIVENPPIPGSNLPSTIMHGAGVTSVMDVQSWSETDGDAGFEKMQALGFERMDGNINEGLELDPTVQFCVRRGHGVMPDTHDSHGHALPIPSHASPHAPICELALIITPTACEEHPEINADDTESLASNDEKEEELGLPWDHQEKALMAKGFERRKIADVRGDGNAVALWIRRCFKPHDEPLTEFKLLVTGKNEITGSRIEVPTVEELKELGLMRLEPNINAGALVGVALKVGAAVPDVSGFGEIDPLVDIAAEMEEKTEERTEEKAEEKAEEEPETAAAAPAPEVYICWARNSIEVELSPGAEVDSYFQNGHFSRRGKVLKIIEEDKKKQDKRGNLKPGQEGCGGGGAFFDVNYHGGEIEKGVSSHKITPVYTKGQPVEARYQDGNQWFPATVHSLLETADAQCFYTLDYKCDPAGHAVNRPAGLSTFPTNFTFYYPPGTRMRVNMRGLGWEPATVMRMVGIITCSVRTDMHLQQSVKVGKEDARRVEEAEQKQLQLMTSDPMALLESESDQLKSMVTNAKAKVQAMRTILNNQIKRHNAHMQGAAEILDKFFDNIIKSEMALCELEVQAAKVALEMQKKEEEERQIPQHENKPQHVRLTVDNHCFELLSLEEQMHQAALYAQHANLIYGTVPDPLSGEPLDVMEMCFNLRVTKEVLPGADKDEEGNEGNTYTEAMQDLESFMLLLATHAPGQGVLITGPNFGGKSALIRRLAVQVLKQREPPTTKVGAAVNRFGAGISSVVPVVVPVHELVRLLEMDAVMQESMGHGDMLDAYLQSSYSADSLRYRFLQQARLEGRLLVLVDGMDKCGVQRPAIEAFVSTELVRRTRLVVTARADAKGFDPRSFSSAFTQVELFPLRENQQLHTVTTLCAHVGITAEELAADPPPKVTSNQRVAIGRIPPSVKLQTALMQELQNRDVAEVCGNPMMLSMYVSVAKGTGGKQLSSRSRCEMLHTIVGCVLSRIDRLLHERWHGSGQRMSHQTIRRRASMVQEGRASVATTGRFRDATDSDSEYHEHGREYDVEWGAFMGRDGERDLTASMTASLTSPDGLPHGPDPTMSGSLRNQHLLQERDKTLVSAAAKAAESARIWRAQNRSMPGAAVQSSDIYNNVSTFTSIPFDAPLPYFNRPMPTHGSISLAVHEMLRKLAFAMQCAKKVHVPWAFVKSEVLMMQPHLMPVWWELHQLVAEEHVPLLACRLEGDERCYQFCSQTMQDYLASLELMAMLHRWRGSTKTALLGRTIQQLCDTIAPDGFEESLDDTWWHRVLFMCCEQADFHGPGHTFCRFVEIFVPVDPFSLNQVVRKDGLHGNPLRLIFCLLEFHPKCSAKLVFAGTCLSTLPDDVAKLKLLEELRLPNNELSELPACLGTLQLLTVLRVNNNSLLSLPDGIGECSALREIGVSNNALSELPSSIGKLASLEILDVEMNNLKALPKEIGQLSNLHTLRASKNKLEKLPVELGSPLLPKLRIVTLMFNQLEDLDDGLATLSGLEELLIGHNLITVFQPQLCDGLRVLANLDVSHNQVSLVHCILPPNDTAHLFSIARISLAACTRNARRDLQLVRAAVFRRIEQRDGAAAYYAPLSCTG
jgi:hypothetical protein